MQNQGRLLSHETLVYHAQLHHILDKPSLHHTQHSESAVAFDGRVHSGDTESDPPKRRMVLKINGLDASQFSFRFAILFSHFTFTECVELRRA